MKSNKPFPNDLRKSNLRRDSPCTLSPKANPVPAPLVTPATNSFLQSISPVEKCCMLALIPTFAIALAPTLNSIFELNAFVAPSVPPVSAPPIEPHMKPLTAPSKPPGLKEDGVIV